MDADRWRKGTFIWGWRRESIANRYQVECVCNFDDLETLYMGIRDRANGLTLLHTVSLSND